MVLNGGSRLKIVDLKKKKKELDSLLMPTPTVAKEKAM